VALRSHYAVRFTVAFSPLPHAVPVRLTVTFSPLCAVCGAPHCRITPTMRCASLSHFLNYAVHLTVEFPQYRYAVRLIVAFHPLQYAVRLRYAVRLTASFDGTLPVTG
jgi:hypothetical protein